MSATLKTDSGIPSPDAGINSRCSRESPKGALQSWPEHSQDVCHRQPCSDAAFRSAQGCASACMFTGVASPFSCPHRTPSVAPFALLFWAQGCPRTDAEEGEAGVLGAEEKEPGEDCFPGVTFLVWDMSRTDRQERLYIIPFWAAYVID